MRNGERNKSRYLCGDRGLQARVELPDQLEILLIQMFIFAFAFLSSSLPFLPSPFGATFELFVVVIDEPFADLGRLV